MNHVSALKRAKSIHLVSLSATHTSCSYFRKLVEASIRDNTAPLGFIYLDDLEIRNQVLICGMSGPEAARVTQSRVKKLSREIRAYGHSIDLKYSEIAEQSFELTSLVEDLRHRFNENSHFRKSIMIQAYRNLHPKLKERNIRNIRDPAMSDIADYLTVEIALKLYLWRRFPHLVEYAPRTEMEIVSDLRSLLADLIPSKSNFTVPIRVITQ